MASPHIAVYLSRHGYGHLVRAGAVLERLAARLPLRLTVVAPQPAHLWPPGLAAVSEWICNSCDVGVVQSDDVTVDSAATGEALERWLERLPQIIERESRRLSRGFDLVLGDVPAAVFEAAAVAAVPSVALANFSWDWIYRELGFEAAAAASEAMYRKAGLLLETTPAAPMDAFARRCAVDLVARRPPGLRSKTRALLGAGEDESLVLVALKADSASLLRFPAPLPGLRYLVAADWPGDALRDDVRRESSLPFLDLLEACDVVLGKPGYGLIGDVTACATRLLYAARPGFPENAILEAWLKGRNGVRRVALEALQCGTWVQDLRALLQAPAPVAADLSADAQAADVLVRCLGAR